MNKTLHCYVPVNLALQVLLTPSFLEPNSEGFVDEHLLKFRQRFISVPFDKNEM